MTIDRRNLRGLVRAIAYDVRGGRLGRVAQVFLDDRTDEPAWVAVDVTRTRGMRLLPLAGAGLKGRHLVIRAQRSTVRSAPRIDLGDGQLSSQDESRLLEHYGLAPAGADESSPAGEHRPASPWPDDTERETAWERPAQDRETRDTQDLTPGWDHRVGDRSEPAQGQEAQAAAPIQPRDTAPSPVTDGPTSTPPPARPQPADRQTDASSPAAAEPQTPERAAQAPIRPRDAAMPVGQADGSGRPSPRPDPESSSPRP